MSFTAQITGADQLPGELQAAYKAGVRLGMERLGIKGAELVQNLIITPYGDKPPAVFSGNLASSIIANVFEEQTLVRLVIGVGPTLGADRYAAPVETGARPHMPPSGALVLWVKQKFGIEDEKEALSAAFAVAKKIAQRGTRGQEMFERGLVELEPLAGPILEQAIAAQLAAGGAQ